MKTYTSIKQSKKLAEILPLESADMWYGNEDHYKIAVGKWKDNEHDEDDVPCWSLAALLGLIPKPLLGQHLEDEYWECTTWKDFSVVKEVHGQDNPLDAAFEMVVWLLENKMI